MVDIDTLFYLGGGFLWMLLLPIHSSASVVAETLGCQMAYCNGMDADQTL